MAASGLPPLRTPTGPLERAAGSLVQLADLTAHDANLTEFTAPARRAREPQALHRPIGGSLPPIETERGILREGWDAFLHSLGPKNIELIGAGLRALGTSQQAEAMHRAGYEVEQYGRGIEMGKAPTMPDWTSLENALRWLSGGLGQGLGSIGAPLVSGAVGAGVGAAAAGPPGAVAGGAGAAFGTNFLLLAGEAGRQFETEGVDPYDASRAAVALAPLMATLDTLGLMKVLRGPMRGASDSMLKYIGKRMAHGASVESVTEMSQGVMRELTAAELTGRPDAEARAKGILEEGLIAAMTGGVVGGAAAPFRARREAPPDDGADTSGLPPEEEPAPQPGPSPEEEAARRAEEAQRQEQARQEQARSERAWEEARERQRQRRKSWEESQRRQQPPERDPRKRAESASDRMKKARAWVNRAHPDKGGTKEDFVDAWAEFQAAKAEFSSAKAAYREAFGEDFGAAPRTGDRARPGATPEPEPDRDDFTAAARSFGLVDPEGQFTAAGLDAIRRRFERDTAGLPGQARLPGPAPRGRDPNALPPIEESLPSWLAEAADAAGLDERARTEAGLQRLEQAQAERAERDLASYEAVTRRSQPPAGKPGEVPRVYGVDDTGTIRSQAAPAGEDVGRVLSGAPAPAKPEAKPEDEVPHYATPEKGGKGKWFTFTDPRTGMFIGRLEKVDDGWRSYPQSDEARRPENPDAVYPDAKAAIDALLPDRSNVTDIGSRQPFRPAEADAAPGPDEPPKPDPGEVVRNLAAKKRKPAKKAPAKPKPAAAPEPPAPAPEPVTTQDAAPELDEISYELDRAETELHAALRDAGHAPKNEKGGAQANVPGWTEGYDFSKFQAAYAKQAEQKFPGLGFDTKMRASTLISRIGELRARQAELGGDVDPLARAQRPLPAPVEGLPKLPKGVRQALLEATVEDGEATIGPPTQAAREWLRKHGLVDAAGGPILTEKGLAAMRFVKGTEARSRAGVAIERYVAPRSPKKLEAAKVGEGVGSVARFEWNGSPWITNGNVLFRMEIPKGHYPSKRQVKAEQAAGLVQKVLKEGSALVDPVAFSTYGEQRRVHFGDGTVINADYFDFARKHLGADVRFESTGDTRDPLLLYQGDTLAGVIMPLRNVAEGPGVAAIRAGQKPAAKKKPPIFESRSDPLASLFSIREWDGTVYQAEKLVREIMRVFGKADPESMRRLREAMGSEIRYVAVPIQDEAPKQIAESIAGEVQLAAERAGIIRRDLREEELIPGREHLVPDYDYVRAAKDKNVLDAVRRMKTSLPTQGLSGKEDLQRKQKRKGKDGELDLFSLLQEPDDSDPPDILKHQHAAGDLFTPARTAKSPKVQVVGETSRDVARVRRVVDRITKDWDATRLPEIRIVASAEALPEQLKARLGSGYRGVDGLFIPYPEGAVIYLVADALPTADKVQRTLIHELVGHYSLMDMLGDEFGPLAARVWEERDSPIWRDIHARVSYAYPDANPDRIAAEMIALAAERRVKHPVLTRLVDAIRRFFRALGFRLALSYDEVMDMLARATERLGTPAPPRTEQQERLDAAFEALSEAVFEHRVWHGSGATFDRFRLTKIGTGEGTQNQGYGLYFADVRAVSESYKSANQRAQNNNSIRFNLFRLAPWKNHYLPGRQRRFIADLAVEADKTPLSNPERYIRRIAVPRIDEQIRDAEFMGRRALGPASVRKAFDKSVKRKVKALKKQRAALLALADSGNYSHKGRTNTARLYEVELAPKAEDYLLWDRPLSQQSQKVRAGVRTAWPKHKPFPADTETGSQIYWNLSRLLGSDRRASRALRYAGVRGNKYEDQLSRGEGQPDKTYNYVLFDDADATVLNVFESRQRPAGEVRQLAEASIPEDFDGIARALDRVYAEMDELSARMVAGNTVPEADARAAWLVQRAGVLAHARDTLLADLNPDVPTMFEARAKRDAPKRKGRWAWFDAKRPVESMFRILSVPLGGLDENGQVIWSEPAQKATRKLIHEMTPGPGSRFAWADKPLQKFRYGWLARHGTPQDFIVRERRRFADEVEIIERLVEYLEGFRAIDMTADESKALQEILEGKDLDEPRLARLAEPVRDDIKRMGKELVELNLLPREAYMRNLGAYLHRSYRQYEFGTPAMVRWGRRMMGRGWSSAIGGDELKRRGLRHNVTMERLLRDVPKDKRAEARKAKEWEIYESVNPNTGRLGRRVYWPKGEPFVPPKWRARKDKDGNPVPEPVWFSRGTWELRPGAKGAPHLWRDYTEAERQAMGEIRDPLFNLIRTYEHFARDLSRGRFFQDIASNEDWFSRTKPEDAVIVDASELQRAYNTVAGIDWVKVPNVTIAKSAAKKWGAIAGGYIRAPLWRDLVELDRMQSPRHWDWLMREWKQNKTSRSPPVHFNNTVGNVILAELYDFTLQDMVRGLLEFARKGDVYREALREGVFGSGFVITEINARDMAQVIDDVIKAVEAKEVGPRGPGAIARTAIGAGVGAAYGAGVAGPPGAGVGAGVGAVAGLAMGRTNMMRIFDLLTLLDRKMRAAYRYEDEVFRLMSYMRDRSMGLDKGAAAQNAVDRFMNYDFRAPWPNFLRRHPLPFFGYTYAFVPQFLKAVTARPWKIAKISTLGYALIGLSFAVIPGDEDEEQRVMSERDRGMTWALLPKLLRLPFSSDGEPLYIGMTRVLPGGGLFERDTNLLGMPEWAMVSGPYLIGAELAMNRMSYTGEDIVDEVDTGVEAAEKRLTYTWRALMPNAPWIPGSWSWKLMQRSIVGETDIFGRAYSPAVAAVRQFGPRLYPYDVATEKGRRVIEIEREASRIRRKVWELKMDRSRNKLTAAEFRRSMAIREEQIKRLAAKARRLTGYDNGDG